MFERYAIFYTPPAGPLADFGASWLGWDSVSARAVAHPQTGITDVADITAIPRKYGLHATLKAPFRLASDAGLRSLQDAVVTFCKTNSPVAINDTRLRHAHGFIALRPCGDTTALRNLAAQIVRDLDVHRQPLSQADIARRRKSALTPRQDRQMLEWGYPFIFDDFHFHLTLTGPLPDAKAAKVIAALAPVLDPIVPRPFVLDALTLMGQDREGMFHQIQRYALTG
jgi:hypothetical protein